MLIVSHLKKGVNWFFLVANRRVRALEEHVYIEKSGERKTKTGFKTALYHLTTRVYLAIALDKINLEDFIEKAHDSNIYTALAAFVLTN